MNKHQLKRPSIEQPNLEHWIQLKHQKRLERKQQCGGVVECNACPSIETEDNKFDLHHRHYDNFGNESLSDVTLLCRRCHEAISVRIWDERSEIEEAENQIKWQEEEDKRKIAWLNSPAYKLEIELQNNREQKEKERRLALEIDYKKKQESRKRYLPKIGYTLIATLILTLFFLPDAFVFVLTFGCSIYGLLWMGW